MTTDNEVGHNGWNNYETWAVNLRLNNDQGSQELLYEMARNELEDAEATEYSTRDQVATRTLADALKDAHEDWWHDRNDAGAPDYRSDVFSDLMGAALAAVDWVEIAHNALGALEEIDA